eukprot:COSAG02_NODE_8297_length_2627_cov_1.624604_2_plen_94_part_00
MVNPTGEQLTAFSELDAGSINVVLMLCFAILLAWSNGANDIANSVGTVRTCDHCGCVCVRARVCVSVFSDHVLTQLHCCILASLWGLGRSACR